MDTVAVNTVDRGLTTSTGVHSDVAAGMDRIEARARVGTGGTFSTRVEVAAGAGRGAVSEWNAECFAT